MAQASNEFDVLAEEAAEWIVRLSGDDPVERSRSQKGYDAWKIADPRHAEAASRMESIIGQVQGVRQTGAGDTRPARAALDAGLASTQRRKRATRQRTVGALLVALALAVPVFFTVSTGSPADLLADERSSESDWVSRTLPDGSRITLSGRAAIDLQFDATHRTVKLLHGDIRVDVAKDATRPFDVETPIARIRALGTRFAVSHENNSTRLEMFESKVSVQPLTGQEGDKRATVVRAGERLQLTPESIGEIEPLDAERVEQGWQQHQLVLNDRPLPEVLAQLARHRPGGIRFDARELQGLRVSAVLPLDKPDEALQLLLTSLPELRQHSFAGRWVWVGLADSSQAKK